MSVSLLVWAILALLVFWMVGVYKRLLGLRSKAVATLDALEKQLRQYASVVKEHLGASVESEISTDWAALLASLDVLDAALKDVQREPLVVSSLSRSSAAFESVQRAWMSLCEIPSDLAGPVVPDAMRQQWEAATAAVHIARSGCNQDLGCYNEAIAQFPASMLVGVLRLKTAGQL